MCLFHSADSRTRGVERTERKGHIFYVEGTLNSLKRAHCSCGHSRHMYLQNFSHYVFKYWEMKLLLGICNSNHIGQDRLYRALTFEKLSTQIIRASDREVEAARCWKILLSIRTG